MSTFLVTLSSNEEHCKRKGEMRYEESRSMYLSMTAVLIIDQVYYDESNM